jgi:Poly(hydroxyalcanoate) granule associated protein (phasin)
MSDKPKKDMDIARKVWLAGIGAYGRAIGDAQDAYAKVGKETSKVFDDLVGRGEDLENTVTAVAKNYSPKMAEQSVRATVATVGDRLERMKAALGLADVAADQQDQLAAFDQRLSAMEAKIDEILAAVKPARPRKPAAKKAAKPKKPAPAKKK